MLRELRTYHRPHDLREALVLLDDPRVRTVPLAGGSELLGRQDTEVEAVVDLQDLPLDYLRAEADDLQIGALTKLQSLVTHPLVRAVAGGNISRAAELSAQLTERIAGTVGGTLAAGTSAHDLLLALLCCDVSVTLQSLRQTETVSLAELLQDRAQYLRHAVLITELRLPAQPPGSRFALVRVARTPRDHAIVNVAVRAAGSGTFRAVRLAVGGAGDRPLRLGVVEALLEGASADVATLSAAANAASQAVRPEGNHIASGEYRRAMVAVLVQRALREIVG